MKTCYTTLQAISTYMAHKKDYLMIKQYLPITLLVIGAIAGLAAVVFYCLGFAFDVIPPAEAFTPMMVSIGVCMAFFALGLDADTKS